MSPPLSIVIINKNGASKITACLESVAFADEIVVVDSGSTDRSMEIAREKGARVIEQEWLGFGPQKQFTVDQATNDWVFSLDVDERVTEELAASIKATLENPALNAYEIVRCNRFLGRYLRHGEGYPDPILRLFNRNHARFSDDLIHEKVIPDGDVGRLKGDLLHESEEGLTAYLEKQDHYTTLQAEALIRRGKRATLPQQLLSPVWRFIKMYFLKLGLLDGWPGLVHIAVGCRNSFSKYAKARAMQRARR